MISEFLDDFRNFAETAARASALRMNDTWGFWKVSTYSRHSTSVPGHWTFSELNNTTMPWDGIHGQKCRKQKKNKKKHQNAMGRDPMAGRVAGQT